MRAPARRAYCGSDAAGYTSADVPTTSIRSQRRAAASACASTSAGSISSNHTTSGRRNAPQREQRGGRSSSGARQVSTIVPSREHFTRAMLPCNSTSFRLPALACRPSTFCVISRNAGTPRSMSAMATCAGLGCACAARSRRTAYQSHTSFGLRSNAEGVASSRGSKCAHNPVCASRNVGTPDSAETPAPVSTATSRASASARARASGMVVAVDVIVYAILARGRSALNRVL